MRRKLLRSIALSAAVVAMLLLAVGPAGGSREPRATCTAQDDQTEGWEAVFGHASSLREATVLLNQARKVGFTATRIEAACGDFEVEVPGGSQLKRADDRAAFALEAKSAGFKVTFEAPCCEYTPDLRGAVEAVFGHFPTLEAATPVYERALAIGFRVEVEQDGPRDFEVELPGGPSGFRTAAERASFAAEARTAHFSVLFEVGGA
jgi:hypothetical protein